jgi:hypothetical protein
MRVSGRWGVSSVLWGAVALVLPTECTRNDFMMGGSDSSFTTKTYIRSSLRIPAGNISLLVVSRGSIRVRIPCVSCN